MTSSVYVLDTSVFLEAHKRYYAFDICPGFWNSIAYYDKAGTLVSIDRVQDELLAGSKAGDLVKTWVDDSISGGFFASTKTAEVAKTFSQMMQWVQGSAQYLDEAKAEFAIKADGWLVAYAKTTGHTLVTEERRDPLIKRKVPIPNVCEQFGVKYTHTFDLLRQLNVQMTWEP